jgi:hypothetical protein
MAKQRHWYVNHNIRTEAYRDEEGGKLETANICSNVWLYDLKGILQRYKL